MNRFYEFYKEIGEKIPEEKLTYSFPNARIRESFIKNILNRYNSQILDLGCGTGRLTLGKDVVGVDLSLEKLIIAKKRNKKGIYIVGDIENLSFIKKKFKIILISEVLEHLRNPNFFLKNLKSVCKKKCVIIITTPNRLKSTSDKFSIKMFKHFGINKGINGEEYLHRVFRIEELEKMLKEAGFETLEIGSIENEFRGICKPLLFLRIFPKFYWYFAPIIMNNLYDFMLFTGIIRIQRRIFKEGIRIYCIAQKKS